MNTSTPEWAPSSSDVRRLWQVEIQEGLYVPRVDLGLNPDTCDTWARLALVEASAERLRAHREQLNEQARAAAAARHVERSEAERNRGLSVFNKVEDGVAVAGMVRRLGGSGGPVAPRRGQGAAPLPVQGGTLRGVEGPQALAGGPGAAPPRFGEGVRGGAAKRGEAVPPVGAKRLTRAEVELQQGIEAYHQKEERRGCVAEKFAEFQAERAELARHAPSPAPLPPVYQKSKRSFAYVRGPAGGLLVDSQAARLSRLNRRVHAWAALIPKEIRAFKRGKETVEAPRLVMVTLTYHLARDWRANHIRAYMLALRAALKSRLIGYSWICENQTRGVPHYHIMLYVRRGTRIPTPDASGMWPHGSSRIETAHSPFYIVKYTAKEYQKQGLPKGARMFAVWVDKKVIDSPAAKLLLNFRASSLPAWFRSEVLAWAEEEDAHLMAAAYCSCWARAPGGGWLLRPTGERFPSPWALVSIYS